MADTKTAKRSSAATSTRFTEAERAAMRERAKEAKAESRRGSGVSREEAESEVLAKIAGMAAPDRVLAERIHALVMGMDPAVMPRLWYGMPAYSKNGNTICWFQDAAKFKSRYATIGFSDKATLDDGNLWPVAYALTTLTAADEARIAQLVKQALG